MKRIPLFGLALGLGLLLSACDYSYGPGVDPQHSQDFSTYLPATANEINRDSLSQQQRVERPIGKGSAADQRTSADAGIQSAPYNASSPTATMPRGESGEVRSTAREQ